MADPDSSRWIYTPTKGVSIAFAVLFAISGIFHLWQNVLKSKSWRIGFLLPCGAALFVAGFILREVGCHHVHDLRIYIASTVLLFCAPPVYAGADYFIFGRVLYYVPYLSPLHPGRVWTTFLSLDVIVEVLAGAGASIAADANNSPSKINAGVIMVRVSLLLQICLFCTFLILILIFHLRCLRAGLCTSKSKIIIYELYASSCFILLRSAYRTANFFLPYTAYANRTEWPFWVFEVLPMTINTCMLNGWPPAKYMPANHKIYLAKDGETELEGLGRIDNRPFLVTLVDPFDVYGIFTGRENTYRYWEEDGMIGRGPAGAEQRPVREA